MKQLVTVIIPNYNRTVDLKRALTSVVNQTYKNLEIIIVDDKSPNIQEITNIVNSFEDKRIKLICSDKKLGGGGARNVGISKAQGQYIAFLDSDDQWIEVKIEEQIKAASCLLEHDILVYSKCNVLLKRRKKELPQVGIGVDERISDYLFVSHGFIQTSSIFVSTKLAKRCFFDESLPRHQDYDFLFKIEKLNPKWVFVPKVLVDIFWDKETNPAKKGWTPEFALKFLSDNSDSFTEKSFSYFLFYIIKNSSSLRGYKIPSLRYLMQNRSNISRYKASFFTEIIFRILFIWK